MLATPTKRSPSPASGQRKRPKVDEEQKADEAPKTDPFARLVGAPQTGRRELCGLNNDRTSKEISARTLVNILTHLHDPRDLYSAIRASSALLDAFQHPQSRIIVLKQVLRNAIQPKARPAALAVLRCPQFQDG